MNLRTLFACFIDDECNHLAGEVRYLRAALNEAQASEAFAIKRMSALEAANTCTDPAKHVQLAHQLEQARAEVAELRGAEAHRASLTPRRGQ